MTSAVAQSHPSSIRSPRRPATPIRIVHLDDHLATRAGLSALVAGEPDLVSVGAAADEAELWTLVHRTHPSLVVLDLHRSGRDGLPCVTGEDPRTHRLHRKPSVLPSVPVRGRRDRRQDYAS